jgi:hypothetical protein
MPCSATTDLTRIAPPLENRRVQLLRVPRLPADRPAQRRTHRLFSELRAEGSLAEAVAKLCAEHDDIHGVLGGIDRAAPDWPAALDRLRRHIDNEEHGLFPAAVIALPIRPGTASPRPALISGPSAPISG